MNVRVGAPLAFAVAALAAAPWIHAEVPDIGLFFDAASTDENTAEAALARIAAEGWRDNYAALIVDVARFLPRPRPRAGEPAPQAQAGAGDDGDRAGGLPGMGGGGFPEAGGLVSSPRARARARLIRFLEQRTGRRFGQDLKRWRRWIWALPDEPHPQYARFKASLYSAVDPAFAEFFPPGVETRIRLDEVDWGGVAPNGIPALDHPATVPARDAGYLKDGNVVFGVVVNGEARAYPKRILAWHELARDRVGGVELTVVYCTLCGTVIPYASEAGGRRLTFATSGLLYRANKLMFDAETRSLWSAIDGRPVIGPLAGSGLELRAHPVVTTTWREWSAAHPDGSVLSLATGHDRDYSEGAAYREYFSHDRLMFEVPEPDDRLKNKAEVLALLLRPAGAAPGTPRRALAVAADFLKRRPVYSLSFAGHELVVLTSSDGANRVYAAGETRFVRLAEGGRAVIDGRGLAWQVEEGALLPNGRDESHKPRVAARRAFWFGWHAQFPETVLVKE
jgi:hypothetical protein